MSSPTLYAVMTGLEATFGKQAVQANNLANVNTPGFRAQLTALVGTPFTGPAADTGFADVTDGSSGYSTVSGGLKSTGSAFDVALTGSGWLVTRNAGGQIVLTRNGQLHLGADGMLQDEQNNTVLGANLQPISLPPLEHLEIGTDGAISGIPAGSGTQIAQQFNRLYVAATPASPLTPLAGGGFGGVANPQALSPAAGAQVKQGYLNRSNVSAVRAMTDMITDVRSFQIETQLQRTTANASNGLDTLITQG